MKKISLVLVVMALVAMAGAAMAADTNSMTITASVTGVCKFVAGGADLTLPALDPSVGNNVSGSQTRQFWCTKGITTDAITADNGINWSGTKRQMKDTVSGESIPYTISITPDGSSNAGPALPRTVTVGASVLGTDYTAKSAGTYNDTITLSINN